MCTRYKDLCMRFFGTLWDFYYIFSKSVRDFFEWFTPRLILFISIFQACVSWYLCESYFFLSTLLDFPNSFLSQIELVTHITCKYRWKNHLNTCQVFYAFISWFSFIFLVKLSNLVKSTKRIEKPPVPELNDHVIDIDSTNQSDTPKPLFRVDGPYGSPHQVNT